MDYTNGSAGLETMGSLREDKADSAVPAVPADRHEIYHSNVASSEALGNSCKSSAR
jgi:hypothetical protein